MNAIPVVLFVATIGCGFVLQASATEVPKFKEKVLVSFDGADGQWPAANLIEVNGKLYSTTEEGGAYGDGTAFVVDPKTGAETVVYSFGVDGAMAYGGLIDVKGILYGTTAYGGSYGIGTVFALDPKTGTVTVLYSFGSHSADGWSPTASLIEVKGTLYGTTLYGGANSCGGDGCGTVFALDPKTGTETVLHSFGAAGDGVAPSANLIDVKGTLYSTTAWGGGGSCGFTSGCGTVFALDPNTGTENVVYSFCSQLNCADGQFPFAGLIDVNGVLFGTTGSGGTNGGGTVFSLETKTGTETVLYPFCTMQDCVDGSGPTSNLIDVNGRLYGTTGGGGDAGCNNGYGCGTVFALDLKSDAETVLHSFRGGTDGWGPELGLIDVKDTLYGTTVDGGGNGCGGDGCGTVFAILP